MKTLIIYDSLYSNTEKLAQTIGKEITDARVVHVSKTNSNSINDIDLLIVGSPTHGGRPSPAIKQLLTDIINRQLTKTRIATFDTGIPAQGQSKFLQFIIKIFGYASPHINKALISKGATQAVKPMTFWVRGKEGPLVDGELERAREWIRAIL